MARTAHCHRNARRDVQVDERSSDWQQVHAILPRNGRRHFCGAWSSRAALMTYRTHLAPTYSRLFFYFSSDPNSSSHKAGEQSAEATGTQDPLFHMDEETPARLAPSERNSQPTPPPADCPDGGYGWVCVACVFAINGFTWGVVAVRVQDFPTFGKLFTDSQSRRTESSSPPTSRRIISSKLKHRTMHLLAG